MFIRSQIELDFLLVLYFNSGRIAIASFNVLDFGKSKFSSIQVFYELLFKMYY